MTKSTKYGIINISNKERRIQMRVFDERNGRYTVDGVLHQRAMLARKDSVPFFVFLDLYEVEEWDEDFIVFYPVEE